MFREKNERKWFSHSALEIKKSTIPGSGLGIFAVEDISAHTVIEVSPVLIFAGTTFRILEEAIGGRHVLADYPFSWPDGNQAFAWGLGSLFQHKMDCNVSWRQHDEGYNRIVFTTKVDVKKGEELFIRYLSDPSGLWFVSEDSDMGKIFEEGPVVDPGARALLGLKSNPYEIEKKRYDNVETLASAMETLDKNKK